MTGAADRIGAVVIGRNEGDRLVRCLGALTGQVARIVYVDSGSTDGSRDRARAAGAAVVALDTSLPFTAARARNTGLAALMTAGDGPDYVQFIDGDCEMRDGWSTAAFDFLETHPQAAVACGRRRERFPAASLYNRLIDIEWDTPVGRAQSCGGDALMRMQALMQVGGYRDSLIAGEEPELCVRLRGKGWEVWRLDAEMTWHDAAITRFSQWWRRTRRAGHAYAEGAALHGRAPERHNMAALRRVLLWGVALPLAVPALLLIWPPLALLPVLIWAAQFLRLALRCHDAMRAALLLLGKIAEAQGVADYALGRLRGRGRGLIEYK
jgi:GT2 family glycosyltransferase